ncbi:mitochondrial amidoxime reducing component 2-like [Elysia marginata]|uniref:Mitochondrial amidoxime reducing component 2-like n=1 Tax=Elysia marginata TaxID=1093978 RepID=A0AAV4FIM7_9GAST|nr:mitochondrial amidoxime reducing component 2-like [Elysia marginata]
MDFSKLLEHKGVILAVVGGAAIATVGVLYMSRRRKQHIHDIDDQYELVGEVTGLYCYPVKSMQAIEHEVGFCSFAGIRMMNARDRQFVVVRSNGDFVTQRQISKLAGIKVTMEGRELKMQADGMPDIKVPVNPAKNLNAVVGFRVWKDTMAGQDCGQEVGEWLNQYLGEQGLRMIIMMPGITDRSCQLPTSTGKDKLIFQDDAPYLLTTEQSLADLKQRLDAPANEEVTMKNFRPNIVVKTTKEAWDEDNWSHLIIGKNMRMRVIFPMARCLLTTVDPETFERRKDGEPLKTLKSFRIFPELDKTNPMFGINLGVEFENSVRIGDPVYARRKKFA